MAAGAKVGRRNKDDPAGRARFGKYFPRAFAYATANLDSDAEARDVVVEAFQRTFAFPHPLGEEEFRLVLFGFVMRLCSARDRMDIEDGLSDPERDVLSLLFDAQLTREEIGALLKVSDQTVESTLLRALKKLRSSRLAGVTTASD